jgi:hypothetical protein
MSMGNNYFPLTPALSLGRNDSVDFLDRAAAPAAVRRASRRTRRRADTLNGESISNACVSREAQLTAPEAGALPFFTESFRLGEREKLYGTCASCSIGDSIPPADSIGIASLIEEFGLLSLRPLQRFAKAHEQ